MLTTKQAAKLLGVTPQMVARYVRSGLLFAEKFGRDWSFEEKNVRQFTARDPGRPLGAKDGKPRKKGKP